jgi:hypothetical protein
MYMHLAYHYMSPDYGASPASGDAVAINSAVLAELGLERVNGMYRFKQTQSITVEVFDCGLDSGRSKPEDNFYTKWIQAGMLRDHNVRVTFKPVPRWTETDELNNLLASGNAPDVCVTYSYATVQSYANIGGITDINPYESPPKWVWTRYSRRNGTPCTLRRLSLPLPSLIPPGMPVTGTTLTRAVRRSLTNAQRNGRSYTALVMVMTVSVDKGGKEG